MLQSRKESVALQIRIQGLVVSRVLIFLHSRLDYTEHATLTIYYFVHIDNYNGLGNSDRYI
jgi:hypothetical protein